MTQPRPCNSWQGGSKGENGKGENGKGADSTGEKGKGADSKGEKGKGEKGALGIQRINGQLGAHLHTHVLSVNHDHGELGAHLPHPMA